MCQRKTMPNNAEEIEPETLADYIKKTTKAEKNFVIVDCRSFIDYNNSHIRTAINAFYSKIIRRRLLNNQACSETIMNHLSHGLGDKVNVTDKMDLILYGETTCVPIKSPKSNEKVPTFKCHCAELIAEQQQNLKNSTGIENNNVCVRCRSSNSSEQFIRFLYEKLKHSKKLKFRRVMLLKGGFLIFHKTFPELCDSQLRKLNTNNIPGSNGSLEKPCEKLAQTANPFFLSGVQNNSRENPLKFKIDTNKISTFQMGLKQQPPLHLRCRRRGGVDDSEIETGIINQEPRSGGANSRGLRLPLSISQPCLRTHQSDEEDKDFGWRSHCPTASNEYKILPATQILDFMFLGCASDALNTEFLKKNGITKVINLSEDCAKPPCLPDDAAHFLRIPIKDSYQSRLIPHFEEAFKFIDAAKQSGDKVLVHCLAGISRSPTLAMAYIMRDKKLRSFEAFDYVKSYRPTICPNLNFMGQLLFYEMHLRDQEILPPLDLNEENEQKCFMERKTDNVSTSDLSSSTGTTSSESPSIVEPEIASINKPDINNVSPPAHRNNLINSNGKRTMDTPLALPEHRPRPSMINFNVKGERRSCPLGFTGFSSTTTPKIDTPSPSTEFSRLDISLAVAANSCNAKLNETEKSNFFENPLFGTKTEKYSASKSETTINSEASSVSNPMFDNNNSPDIKTKVNHENLHKSKASKVNSASFLRHILPQKCASDFHCLKTESSTSESLNKKPKKLRKLHCRGFLAPENLRFRCLLANKVRILPTVIDTNEPEASVSSDSRNNSSELASKSIENDDEEFYSFDESDEKPTSYTILERSRKNARGSQISDSQESGFVEDFNIIEEIPSTDSKLIIPDDMKTPL